jgi:D-glycero-D-manno-heptose 1,7-bisphosphate phosphatase
MARIPENQAVFFELDGVIVQQPRTHPDGSVPYLPHALQALGRIDPTRFKIFLATNRTDIALGNLRERDFKKLCERFLADCEQQGIRIAKIYTCPYHPKGKLKYRKDSVFRKPAPGMFKMAQQEFDLNLGRCWMVGHTTVDILAGSRAGMGTILVRTGAGGHDGEFHVEPHFVEPDVRAAVARIASFEHALRT